MLLIERADFQGDGGRFSCSVAARRQTAANFSSYFQMAALCRDAARAPCCAKWKPTPPPSCNWRPTWTTSPCNSTARTPANGLLKPGNAPATSWTRAAATAAHRPRHRHRPRLRANKNQFRKSKAAFGNGGRFFLAKIARASRLPHRATRPMQTSNALHQISNAGFKRICNGLNREQRRIFHASLDAAQKSPVNVGFGGESFLGQTPLQPRFPNPLTELLRDVMAHLPNFSRKHR